MKKLITLSAIGLSSFAVNAQLTITDSLSNATIAMLLEGIGVTVSNVTVNCPSHALGHFIGTSELYITEGLLITSGSADMVAGASTQGASAHNSGLGDADLDTDLGLPGGTNDACMLEFDCVPVGDTLLFNFSFGSEEYMEFVGSSFNDAFAIYLSGPGFPIPTNVASLPGGTLVAINNVNAGQNNTYYYDNENPMGQYVAYDGFTTNLTAFAVVQPGQQYHFKVVVADVMDGILDSGVFLEAFSFRSPLIMNASEAAVAPVLNAVVIDGELVVTASSDVSGSAVQVVDASGRIALSSALTGSRSTFNVSSLPEGVYGLRTITAAGLQVVRFVKD